MRLSHILSYILNLRSWKVWFDSDMHTCLLVTSYLIIVNNAFSLTSFYSILALIISLSFYLSYTFLINDVFDRSYDIVAGKKEEASKSQKYLELIVIIIIITICYLTVFLVINQPLFFLVYTMTFFLATFYSAPPLRFKGRGFIGVLCDSLIEKALPVLLIFIFFNYYNFETIFFFILFFLLQLKIIIHHQIIDFEGDLKSGVSTFVVNVGYEISSRIVTDNLRPILSIMFFILFMLFTIKIPNFLYMMFGLVVFFFVTWQFDQKGIYEREEEVLPLPFHLAYAYFCLMSVIPLYFMLLMSLKSLEYSIFLAITIGSQLNLLLNQYRRLFSGVLEALKGV